MGQSVGRSDRGSGDLFGTDLAAGLYLADRCCRDDPKLSNFAEPEEGNILAGIGLSLGLFVVFKFILMLGNVVAYRIPTPAKLWDAISILIPFVGH